MPPMYEVPAWDITRPPPLDNVAETVPFDVFVAATTMLLPYALFCGRVREPKRRARFLACARRR